MAYDPQERISRMRKLEQVVNREILLCDDEQDLLALASMLIISSKTILISRIGVDGTRAVFERAMKKDM